MRKIKSFQTSIGWIHNVLCIIYDWCYQWLWRLHWEMENDFLLHISIVARWLYFRSWIFCVTRVCYTLVVEVVFDVVVVLVVVCVLFVALNSKNMKTTLVMFLRMWMERARGSDPILTAQSVFIKTLESFETSEKVFPYFPTNELRLWKNADLM